MSDRTFVMIKPDAVKHEVIGAIIRCCEDEDLVPIGLRMLALTEDIAKALYREHDGRPYYSNLIAFSLSGPVVVMVLEGPDAVSRFRRMLGATNPAQADPNTLRRRFGLGIPNNAVHGSDSETAARREIALFFSEHELHSRSVIADTAGRISSGQTAAA